MMRKKRIRERIGVTIASSAEGRKAVE